MTSRTIEVSVEVPDNLTWQEVALIEDEMSKAAGDILLDHGFERQSHTRRVKAVYE